MHLHAGDSMHAHTHTPLLPFAALVCFCFSFVLCKKDSYRNKDINVETKIKK